MSMMQEAGSSRTRLERLCEELMLVSTLDSQHVFEPHTPWSGSNLLQAAISLGPWRGPRGPVHEVFEALVGATVRRLEFRNLQGETALMMASALGDVAVVEILLRHGALPNAVVEVGRVRGASLRRTALDLLDISPAHGGEVRRLAREWGMLTAKQLAKPPASAASGWGAGRGASWGATQGFGR